MQEADILARLRAREYRAAFELLLPRQRDHVYRLALSILRNAAAAEDVTQDVLLRVWQALPGYDGRAALSTWIYAITRNACLSELRKRRPTVSLEALIERGHEPGEGAGVSQGRLDPHDHVVRDVERLLEQLPARYGQAVRLFYMEDKSYEQTALALDVPLGTLKAMLHRARRRLAALVEE